MATDTQSSRCLHLVADIGGTNARFAFAESSDPVLAPIATYAVTDFLSFQDVLVQLQRDWVEFADPGTRLTKICLAVAAIPEEDEISFTNNPWCFTRAGVAEQIGCSNVRIVNDFAAVARSLTALGPEDLEEIGGGRVASGAPKVAIGPGTGFGVATLAFDSRGDAIVLPGEGGHADFAPITHVEEKILRRLRSQYGRVSIERLLCSSGIMNIYRCLADIRGVEAPKLDPEDVGSAARAGEDALAGETMNTFFSVLGAAAGNLALTLGARGGVYIAGGIAPRYIDLLRKSDFRERFLAKGRFADFNGQIATSVVTHPDPGLLGAALLCVEEGGSEY